MSLYVDRTAGDIRSTDDVDILVELANCSGFAVLDEKPRSKGFINDVESGLICRYLVNGVVVNVLPTDEKIPGFSNVCYIEGFSSAITIAQNEEQY